MTQLKWFTIVLVTQLILVAIWTPAISCPLDQAALAYQQHQHRFHTEGFESKH
jgi:hypothetical protein